MSPTQDDVIGRCGTPPRVAPKRAGYHSTSREKTSLSLVFVLFLASRFNDNLDRINQTTRPPWIGLIHPEGMLKETSWSLVSERIESSRTQPLKNSAGLLGGW